MSICLHLSCQKESVSGTGTLTTVTKQHSHEISSCVDVHSHLLSKLHKTIGLLIPKEIANVHVPLHLKDFLWDCLNLSARCLKIVLNNQDGCKYAFNNLNVIIVLTVCLLHPNYGTKALILDLLSALCLIEGGHTKVLQAFDSFRLIVGERLRFEYLIESFKHHEESDLDLYNIEFAVACVQFFNIVVHSPENINLRVYLQYEMHLQGLDDLLKALSDDVGDRLRQHADAYLGNRVDCSLLLEDAEARELATAELERMESEVNSKLSACRQEALAESEATFKARELELSELVESLRSRIRDLNVTAWDREKTMRNQAEQLKLALNKSQQQVVSLNNELELIKASRNRSNLNDKLTISMATSTNFDSTSMVKEDSVSTEDDQTKINASECRTRLPIRSTSAEYETLSSLSESVDKFSSAKRLENPKAASQNTKRGNDSVTTKVSCLDQAAARRMASEAASSLTKLVSQLCIGVTADRTYSFTSNHLIAPVGWTARFYRLQSETVFDENVLKKSLALNSISTSFLDNSSGIFSSNALPEPWLSAVRQSQSLFHSSATAAQSHSRLESVEWLVQMELIPNSFDQLLSPIDVGKKMTVNLPLLIKLLELDVNPIVAHRLLCQIRALQDCIDLSSSDVTTWPSYNMLNTIESVLSHHWSHLRQPGWLNNTANVGDERWFWTNSMLHICLLRHLFSTEVQRITEGLTVLLTTCTSILVSSKLPIILKLVHCFASKLTADFDSNGFPISNLDSLIDWQLSTTNLPNTIDIDMTTATGTVSNDPTPVVDSVTGTGPGATYKRSRVCCSFVQSIVNLVNETCPNLLDWTDELSNLESASRVSIDDMHDRIWRIYLTVQVWNAIAQSDAVIEHCSVPISSIPTTMLCLNMSVNEIHSHVIRLRQAAESIQSVLGAAAYWSVGAFNSVARDNPPIGSTVIWIGSLARFSATFKHCVSDFQRKQRNNNSHSGSGCQRERRSRPEKTNMSGPEKREHRHRKCRTRQLDTDGLMDDILAGLTSHPLRADLHMKRNNLR